MNCNQFLNTQLIYIIKIYAIKVLQEIEKKYYIILSQGFYFFTVITNFKFEIINGIVITLTLLTILKFYLIINCV